MDTNTVICKKHGGVKLPLLFFVHVHVYINRTNQIFAQRFLFQIRVYALDYLYWHGFQWWEQNTTGIHVIIISI